VFINNHRQDLGGGVEKHDASPVVQAPQVALLGSIFSRMRANWLRSAVTGGADVTCVGESVLLSTRSESEKI
jgi:hypothetical protein